MLRYIRYAVGAFLIITGIVVFATLVMTPLFHDGSEDYPVWEVVNYFMTVGTIFIVLTGIHRRISLGEDASTTDQLVARFVFYGGFILAMLYFWGWFWTLNPDSETGNAVTSHLVYFPIVDAIYVVLAVSNGRFIFRNASAS